MKQLLKKRIPLINLLETIRSLAAKQKERQEREGYHNGG